MLVLQRSDAVDVLMKSGEKKEKQISRFKAGHNLFFFLFFLFFNLCLT